MIEDEEAEVAAWFEARADKRIDTACARVFLTGPLAFKVKRRVELGYLDFSTLDLRRRALDRELAFNRGAAPDIYRAVRKITRAADGGLELDGDGPPVEFALEMRRFDETAVLAASPWSLDGPLADALGRAVAGFHAKAPLRPRGGGGRALKYAIDSNAALLTALGPRLGVEPVARLVAATKAEFDRRRSLLDSRRDQGFARHCHGDLHLGNILLEDARPILFDCIEFNDRLSEIDVLYDVAFLLMDLDFRHRRDAAVRVLSAYLDEAARSFPPELWEGLAALPLMLSVRAAVRAHVWAHSGDEIAARAYLEAALAHLEPPPPRLVGVGGLSGSGKTTFARLIAPRLGAAPGAVVMRTDEIRKRLAGAAPDDRLDQSAYGPEFDERVYATLFDQAARSLAAGRAVVLDATFLDPALRARAEAVARSAGVAFDGLWMEAPAAILAARIEGRRGDASDATTETLALQVARDMGDLNWLRLDASGPAEAVAETWSMGASGL